jgi:hypothetical protein
MRRAEEQKGYDTFTWPKKVYNWVKGDFALVEVRHLSFHCTLAEFIGWPAMVVRRGKEVVGLS